MKWQNYNVLHSLVGARAQSLVRSHVTAEDRVVILGAGGWFGRTAIALLHSTGASVLPVASRARQLQIAELDIRLVEWDASTVSEFAPTVVIDCAFLTHHRVGGITFNTFVETNRNLTERFIWTASLPSVRKSMTISSGAAVYPKDASAGQIEDNPYGYLKREAELRINSEFADAALSMGIARVWSVSGALMPEPHAYALGDMILQAQHGRIEIRATTPVWRRYCLAEEVLAILLANSQPGVSLVESGGHLLEMQELAVQVQRVVNPDAQIFRLEVSGEPNRYHSDGVQWAELCSQVGLVAEPIRSQIELTLRGIEALRP